MGNWNRSELENQLRSLKMDFDAKDNRTALIKKPEKANFQPSSLQKDQTPGGMNRPCGRRSKTKATKRIWQEKQRRKQLVHNKLKRIAGKMKGPRVTLKNEATMNPISFIRTGTYLRSHLNHAQA